MKIVSPVGFYGGIIIMNVMVGANLFGHIELSYIILPVLASLFPIYYGLGAPGSDRLAGWIERFINRWKE